MAVVLEVQGPGMTPEQYDELLRMVDWENQPARNGIFHVAWFDDEGLRIVDVWESVQAWHDFVNERLAPAFAQFGMIEPPSHQFHPAHRYFNTQSLHAAA